MPYEQRVTKDLNSISKQFMSEQSSIHLKPCVTSIVHTHASIRGSAIPCITNAKCMSKRKFGETYLMPCDEYRGLLRGSDQFMWIECKTIHILNSIHETTNVMTG
mmetsp:Transcript_6422/g.7388  ORF Transcript_6422/g.7388 Transcript_6422/m.7388 type:complete len:105 (-) Transcript_6422:1196-1510(-)